MGREIRRGSASVAVPLSVLGEIGVEDGEAAQRGGRDEW